MTYYRYIERWVDELKVELRCEEWTVVKETPKGVWLSVSKWKKPRWMRLGSRRQFACKTKEIALNSYIRRKTRQQDILTRQMKRANLGKFIAQELAKELEIVSRSNH